MTKKIVAKAVVLIVGASDIDKAIASIKTKGANLDNAIQTTGRSVLAHIERCGDTTLADRLFYAMPNGSRRNCLAEWLLAFGQVRLLMSNAPDDKEGLKAGRVFGIDRTKQHDAAGAAQKLWHEMRKQADVQTVFDCQAAVTNLLQRIQSAVGKGMCIEGQEQALTLLVAALKPVQPALPVQTTGA